MYSEVAERSGGKLFNVETWLTENIFSSYFLLLVHL